MADDDMLGAVSVLGLIKLCSTEGLDTALGRLFDESKELSGGEWQRLAVARAYLHNAPFTILDEPTAALDPIAEYGVYKTFCDITQGRTTLFVSHRLGVAKRVDQVVVINNGCVAELGTHAELVEADSLYSAMYKEQASWYEQKTVTNE